MRDMTIDFTVCDDDGNEVTLTLPARYEVCPRCDGRGRHVNPAVDEGGITQSEMEELGPDFLEDYMGGVYDVTCYECHGLRVVPVVDEDALSEEDHETLRRYREHQEEEASYRAMCESERRYGA